MTRTDWSSDWSYTLPISCHCHGGWHSFALTQHVNATLKKTTAALCECALQNVEPFIVKCDKLKKLPSWTPLCQVNDSPALKSFSFSESKAGSDEPSEEYSQGSSWHSQNAKQGQLFINNMLWHNFWFMTTVQQFVSNHAGVSSLAVPASHPQEIQEGWADKGVQALPQYLISSAISTQLPVHTYVQSKGHFTTL